MFAGAPLPTVAGAVAACIVSYYTGDVSGTVNLDTGALMLSNYHLRSLIYTGGDSVPTSPCPVCHGDPTPRDGQREGTCTYGARAGQPCDIMIDNPTFDGVGGDGTSMDCPPQENTNVANFPLTFSPTSTDPVRWWELTSASPNCTGLSSAKCFCDTCNNSEATACRTDADCPVSGGAPGKCGGKRCLGGSNKGNPCTSAADCPSGQCSRVGEPSRPDACIGADPSEGGYSLSPVCLPESGGEGRCADGPVDPFCSDNPHIGCSDDTACQLAGAGVCQSASRECFINGGTLTSLNPLQRLEADGYAAPFVNGEARVKIGSLFCGGATSSTSLNKVVGLPGPNRLEQEVLLQLIP